MTAFIFNSATVVAGLVRSTLSRMPAGSASASTFRPTFSAVVGSTCFSTTFVQVKHVGPDLLVAEGVEAKHALAFRDHCR
jgi:hypothetical protein